jgi:glycosyltransferase involved in cell wall biosynthesis
LTSRNNTGRQRVLLVSLFHPELVRGGAQQICYELFEGLAPHADVTLLASVDASYPALFKPGAQITGFDNRPGEFLFLMQDYDSWWHKTSCVAMIDAFVEFLETIRPDVVHFHHFHTFGADFISLARRTLPAAKILFTCHDFMAICAADGHMVRKTDRSLCERPSQVRCHQCFPDHPPEDFLARKMWFQAHLAHVDVFTCPSRFMIEPFVEWGIPREKIFLVTNGQMLRGHAQPPAPGPKNRFGFFGQLVDDKGLHMLLRAVRLLRGDGFTRFSLDINGDNIKYASAPVRKEIEDFLAAEALLPEAERIVVFNGSYQPSQLAGRMARVDWCIVPSLWREVFGLVVSEAWMFGKPVICSNEGGLAERVIDGVGGLQFELGDHRALARTMLRACTEEGLWERLRATLPEPPKREDMVGEFLAVYRAG